MITGGGTFVTEGVVKYEEAARLSKFEHNRSFPRRGCLKYRGGGT